MSIPRFTPGFRLINGSDLNAAFAAVSEQSVGGVTYFVNETHGSNAASNGGLDPSAPLASLDRALALETIALAKEGLSSVGRNSTVAFWGTQHRTSTLNWNLPGTNLVGICADMLRGKRARISVTGTTGFDKLVKVTAAGCQFSNFATFYGWIDSSTSLLAWSDEAGRSSYNNVEFMGFGDNTASTGSSKLAGSRALKYSGVGETTFRDCVFGVDTTDRDAANYTVEIVATPGAPRISFIDCVFECRLGASGGGASHFLIGASGIDRYLDIVRGRFHNFSTTAMAQALNISASAGGTVVLDQCTIAGLITAWQGTPTANVQMNMTAPGAGGGKAIQNA